ncbi:hypothetical protein E4T56_gene18552 [Termitomyces sp. T112]|nr:hypothetical protein E4T56_gene18552 [Termitomyces sp. T112]
MPVLAAPQAGATLLLQSHVAPMCSLPQGVPMDSPPLAFPHREALYKDVQSVGCELPEEEEGKKELTSTPDPESPDETIDVGSRIYASTLCPPPTVAEIWASQTTSQHLAEAFVANSWPKPFHSTVPNHFYDVEDVFFKASFDSLPEHKQWDHAIELMPDAEPSSCKVYPLVPLEQDELDTFPIGESELRTNMTL